MLISSTDHRLLRSLAVASLLVLGACSSKKGLDLDMDGEKHVSKYAEQREGEAASESDAIHIPPVPHDPSVEGPAQEAIPEYFRAIQAVKAGKLNDAMIMLQSLSSRYPQLSGPLVNQGLIYLEQDKNEDAETVLKQALEVNGQNPYAYNALGLALREQGKFDESRSAYESALALDPKYARAHFNLGVLAELYMQDLNLALSHFRLYQSLQKQPDQTVANWIVDLERRAPAPPPATVAQPQPESPNGEVN
jgi:tetratricopeptide (TPR) repeat protein